MKPKKNPNADLKKRTGLFFSIGLALATFASLYALNYRSVDKEKGKIEFDKGTGTGDEEIENDVQFFAIEQKPMFEQCKGLPKEEQEKCFKKSLDAFVNKNLVYPDAAIQMGSQGRVVVQFRIKKDGSVEVINTQGKDKILEKEARRVIEKLPKLIPGKQRDRPVAVIFSYPIVFKLN